MSRFSKVLMVLPTGAVLMGLAGPLVATKASAQSATTTDLSSAPNPWYEGQPIALQAVVDAPVSATGLSGTMAFNDGSTPLGTVALAQSGFNQGTLSAAGALTCAISRATAAECWGRTDTGDGTKTERDTPVEVSGLSSGVIAISAGCAVTREHVVKCWGDNSVGELGINTTSLPRYTPVLVKGIDNAVTVSVGSGHTCALLNDGRVKCWGYNEHGQIGDGTTTTRPRPVYVPHLLDAIAISAGQDNTCAVTKAGAIKCWGYGYEGAVGDGTLIDRLTPTTVVGFSAGGAAVSVGTRSACAITTAGAVKCWGDNYSGELGDGGASGSKSAMPVDVVGLAGGATAISVGHFFACAVVTGGGVKCWGANAFGALGDGTTRTRSTPVDVSGLTSGAVAVSAARFFQGCAKLQTGIIKCWGANHYGSIGDGTTTNRLTPVQTLDIVGLARGGARLTTALPPSASSPTTHTLGATYSGDTRHAGSSATVTQTVY